MTWINLGDTMTSGISETKTNTVGSHLHVESKQNRQNPRLRTRDRTGGYLRWQVGEGDWVTSEDLAALRA